MGYTIRNLSNNKEIYLSSKKAEMELSERIRYILGALDEQEMTGYSSDLDQIGGP